MSLLLLTVGLDSEVSVNKALHCHKINLRKGDWAVARNSGLVLKSLSGS